MGVRRQHVLHSIRSESAVTGRKGWQLHHMLCGPSGKHMSEMDLQKMFHLLWGA